MMEERVRALVKRERPALLENTDSVAKAVITRPHRGMTVALGLLSLGEISEARQWLRALTDECVVYADEKWDAKYKQSPRGPASPGPWEDYLNGVFSSLLSRHDTENTSREILDRATNSFVDDLENRRFAHEIGVVRILAGYITESEDIVDYTTQLESNVQEYGGEWELSRYLPYTLVIRGLQAESKSDVSKGISGLLTFHRKHIVESSDADAVQKAVALDATVMLALARLEGMDITVEHEAIPDALNDDEHYPIGGE